MCRCGRAHSCGSLNIRGLSLFGSRQVQFQPAETPITIGHAPITIPLPSDLTFVPHPSTTHRHLLEVLSTIRLARRTHVRPSRVVRFDIHLPRPHVSTTSFSYSSIEYHTSQLFSCLLYHIFISLRVLGLQSIWGCTWAVFLL